MLRLHTFGSLAVHGPAGPLGGAAAQPRRLAVLVLVARGGARGTARAKLLGLLWPDATDAQARRAIAQALYSLRRDLGRDDVIVGTHVLQLNGGAAWCDVVEFEAALARGEPARAVELYAGPFLDGFRCADAPEFDRWADEERTAIQHRFHHALEDLAESAEARRDFEDASRWWRRLSAGDPLNARVALATMRALAAAGDRAAALRHAGLFEALVAEELAMPADREVLALAESLRRGATPPAAPATPAAPTAPAARPGPAPRAVAVLPLALLGKPSHPELDQRWADALAEEMIHALLGVPGVRVLARGASVALGESPSLTTLRGLGLTHAVEGSLRPAPAGVRLTLRLVDTADGHAVWWDRLDCAHDDAHDVHESVAARVARQLGTPERGSP